MDIFLDATPNCNNNCNYCLRRLDYQNPIGDLLSTTEIVNLARELKPDSITLSGGEPTMRTDLVKLVTELSDFDIGIISNGRNIDKLVEVASLPNLTVVQYSIHGNPWKYKIIKNMKKLQSVMASDDILTAKVMLTQKNMTYVNRLIPALEKLGFGTGKEKVEGRVKYITTVHAIIPFDFVDPKLIIRKHTDMPRHIQRYVNAPKTDEEYARNIFSGEDIDCLLTIPIRADGEVMLCNGYYGPFSFGNIRKDAKLALRKRQYFMLETLKNVSLYDCLPAQDPTFIRRFCALHIKDLFDSLSKEELVNLKANMDL